MTESRRFSDLGERVRESQPLRAAIQLAADHLDLSPEEVEYLWAVALAGVSVGLAHANERWTHALKIAGNDQCAAH